MPLEPKPTSLQADSLAASAIENEIPAYRAIAPGAIVALILGVASILCFVSWYFLALAGLALLVGFTADRKIQRFPDLFVGRGMAQAGLGLGLVFGLTAVTIGTAQSFLLAKQAKDFGRAFASVLAKDSFEQIVWWGQRPQVRVNNTPEKLVADMTNSPQNAARFEEENGSVRRLKKALASPGSTVHFERLENYGVDELTPWASATFEVHSPDVKPGEEFAAVLYKAEKNKNGVNEWWIEKIAFPAKPGTFKAPVPKPVDDGHGHAH